MPTGNGSPTRKRVRHSVSFRIPIKALSTNRLYRGRKHRTSAYDKYRREVFSFLKDNVGKDGVVLVGRALRLHIEVGFSSPLSDLSNCNKGIEDIVAEYFEFNDRMIIDIVLVKYLVDKGKEYINLSVKSTRRNYDLRTKAGR